MEANGFAAGSPSYLRPETARALPELGRAHVCCVRPLSRVILNVICNWAFLANRVQRTGGDHRAWTTSSGARGLGGLRLVLLCTSVAGRRLLAAAVLVDRGSR